MQAWVARYPDDQLGTTAELLTLLVQVGCFLFGLFAFQLA
jgi:hypothetical protein